MHTALGIRWTLWIRTAIDNGKINQLVFVSEEEISSVLYENIIGNGCNGACPSPMCMADS